MEATQPYTALINSDTLLNVNEIFETVQGEATFTGTPSVFIRLQGCGVGCGWCDTKHTWETDSDAVITPEAMRNKTEDSPQYARLTVFHLVSLMKTYQAKHIVITGGEPCEQNIYGLTTALVHAGFTVQVETSGTQPINVHPDTWVTVSPKINMPGGLPVLDEAIARANEIKHPVGRARDLEFLDVLLETTGYEGLVWLQPLSQSTKATQLCLDTALARTWRVSIQTHKFIGVR